MSELEFEEVKGLWDLGFAFSDAKVASIVYQGSNGGGRRMTSVVVRSS